MQILEVQFFLCVITLSKLFTRIYSGQLSLSSFQMHHGTYAAYRRIWWVHTCQILTKCHTPCGEGTVVLIVSCRCTYCCPEPIHGKIIWHRSSYFVVAICYVQNCELSYNVLGMTENCNHTEWIYYRTGCGIWPLVGGKGANVIMNN